MNDTSPKRPYRSSLRARQSEETRTAILEALGRLMAQTTTGDLSIARLAELAGVSEPTVYRYFPNRESLVQGFEAHWRERTRGFGMPETPEELVQSMGRLFRFYDEHEAIMRAARKWPAANEFVGPQRAQRSQRFQEMLAPLTAHLPPEDAAARHAVLRYLCSSQAWHSLTGEHGQPTEAAARAVTWALATLLETLRREVAAQHTTGGGSDP